MTFAHLKELMPEIEKAHIEYELVFNDFNRPQYYDGLQAAAKEFNKVLVKAVEAIYLDTSAVNSRETILQAFGRIREGHITYFGHEPYKRLKEIVEAGSLRNLNK